VRPRHASLGDDAEVFLDTDGTYWLMFNEDYYENRILARAAWQRCRRASWAHEWRDTMWPPVAAQVYDGVGATADEVRPWQRSDDPAGTLDEFRAAVEADIASVTAFRLNDPDAADEVDDYLDVYLADLRGLLGIVEEMHDGTGDHNRELSLAAGTWEKPSLRKSK
jgi:hypothetical protein